MALEAALEKLCSDLRYFRDALGGLETTATQDRPETEGGMVVDEVSDGITELESLCKECLDGAEAALRAVAQPFDANRLRRSLAGSQLRFLSASHLLFSNLLAFEKISALVGFGRTHGREWAAWAHVVRQGLERCREFGAELANSYFACWEEIAERLVAGPIALHTTNIGQQISADALHDKRQVEAGIT
jgi:hypothetical protein